MSVKDEVMQRLDIVAIVGETVPLQRAGRNFKANCPFHTEKTPSFYVMPDRQIWRCFGACATGGDLISFVMKAQGLDFTSALKQLAARAGVTYHERREDPVEVDHLARLRSANEAAARYFHNLLLNGGDGADARAYVDRRQISPEMVRDLMLGYSLDTWDGLKHHLEAQGFTTEELQQAGLLIEGERGAYDRFRGRLMFPIWDAEGRIAGFGARTLGDATPKYLNSPQTPLFDKSSILYLLHRGRNHIRETHTAVIVEGYMDALTAHQHGYTNVVASMGTALTEKQMALLGRSVDRVVLALDSDAAGQNAILRGLETAPAGFASEPTAVPAWRGKVRWQRGGDRGTSVRLPEGVTNIVMRQRGEIRVLQLPHGKDPDELIRSTPELWEQLVADAMPMMEFLLLAAQRQFDLTDPRGKSQAVELVLPFVAQLPGPVEQAHWVQRLATLIAVPEATLLSELSHTRPKATAHTAAPEPAPVNPVRQQLEQSEVLEDYCLALLLQVASLRVAAAQLRPDHFLTAEMRTLFELWRDTPEALATEAELDLDLADRLAGIRAVALPPLTEALAHAAFAQCYRRLEERRLRDLKLHHQLRFMQEQHELGANELAARAYLRLQDGDSGDDDSPLVGVQEQELALNQQLHSLMQQNHERRIILELPVVT